MQSKACLSGPRYQRFALKHFEMHSHFPSRKEEPDFAAILFQANRYLKLHGHVKVWNTDGQAPLLVWEKKKEKSPQHVTASLPLGTYPARLYQKSTNRYHTSNAAASALLFHGTDPGLLQSSVVFFGN